MASDTFDSLSRIGIFDKAPLSDDLMTQLQTLRPVCRAIAALLPGQVEVVLHDLRKGQIVLIENPFSSRAPGADSLNEVAEYESELAADGTIGPYLKANSDGSRLRSVSALLRDDLGEPFGLMCLNLRLTELEAARDVLNAFTSLGPLETPKLLKSDWREVTNAIIAATLRELKLPYHQMRRSERMLIIGRLLDADIFSSRGSAGYVADALGVSRASVYSMIKMNKQNASNL